MSGHPMREVCPWERAHTLHFAHVRVRRGQRGYGLLRTCGEAVVATIKQSFRNTHHRPIELIKIQIFSLEL